MDMTLLAISGTCTYLDYTVISGATREEHTHRLERVLDCLKIANLQ